MSKYGQMMLEYLLLLALVAFIVLGTFSNNGVIRQTSTSANEYYKVGVQAIYGAHYDQTSGAVVTDNPQPINGEWCAYSECVRNFRVRECACPRPAFGGTVCSGDAIEGCS